MKKYMIANWECNGTRNDAMAWIQGFAASYGANTDSNVVVAPPLIFVPDLKQAIEKQQRSDISLAVQDLSPFAFGAYTGAVAAEMLQGIVTYAIVGHSSRRRYFHETDQDISNKVNEAIRADITPIVCIGRASAESQIAALEENDLEKVIIAYEPVRAIGFGPHSVETAEYPDDTFRMIKKISIILPERPILYAGPINAGNARDYFALEGVTGLLLDSLSLDSGEFAHICNEVSTL